MRYMGFHDGSRVLPSTFLPPALLRNSPVREQWSEAFGLETRGVFHAIGETRYHR